MIDRISLARHELPGRATAMVARAFCVLTGSLLTRPPLMARVPAWVRANPH
ncbi:hypothetical protein KQH60_11050 [Mycetohabitans sp. B8]|uniref:hypothetical protein n=1 Tax=Mycetohabitans sp. B8 TaxID=2841845 RepID=UPI001F180610|nr:hypothetical protein [Mycetohabitans sp. B8]MCG1043043.1 hypothetical protein [Mycetohabitans sp. B8]